MPEPKEPLNGQQIQALQSAWSKALATTLERMELRRFAIEQAAKLAPADKVMGLARQISDFLTEPAVEVRVRLD